MSPISRRSLLMASPALGLGACAPGRTASRPDAEPGSLLVDLDRGPDLVIPLWPEGAPSGEAVTIEEKIIERDNAFGLRDRAAIDITRPTLSLFRSPSPSGAAILLIPGGGYARVVIDKEGYEGARYFNRFGYDVYVLKYRLPHQGWAAGSETPLQDARQAMRLIRSGAGRGGLATGAVMVMGFSAGGHLAGLLCQRYAHQADAAVDAKDAETARPDAGVLVYPVALMQGPHIHEGSRNRLIGMSPSQAASSAYDLTVSPNPSGPPIFLLHALDDTAVPAENSLRLASALRDAGLSAVLHLFREGGHGFGMRGIDDKPAGRWPALVMDWWDGLEQAGGKP